MSRALNLDEKVSARLDSILDDERELFEFRLTRCESPIEQLFMLELQSDRRGPYEETDWPDCVPNSERRGEETLYVHRNALAGHGCSAQSVHCRLYDLFAASGLSGGYIVGGGEVPWIDAVGVWLQPEMEIDGRRIRLDFAVITDAAKVAIELDGHDFHERTKEQAARDKSRDRALQSLGWKPFRFTGSEVWNDAPKCVFEVTELLTVEALKKRFAK